MVIKRFTPSRWLAFIVFSWGIVSTLTGITQNLGGLVACRIIMGIFEAGLFPGLSMYLTAFYTRQELGLRYSYLFTCNGLAGALGGLIAYAIGYMEGVAGLRAWRWIFIIEGLPTVVLGVVTWFCLADTPETAGYLTADEKALLMARRARQAGFNPVWDEFHKEDVMRGVKDWKVYVMAFGQFCGASMLYGYSTFLPTIILGLGRWDRVVTNAMTVPCYALGVITFLVVAWVSDKIQLRGIFPAVCGCISVIGYGVLVADLSAGAHYAGCLLIGTGLFVLVGMPLAWLPMSKFPISFVFFWNVGADHPRRHSQVRQASLCLGFPAFHLQSVRRGYPIRMFYQRFFDLSADNVSSCTEPTLVHGICKEMAPFSD